ncbi:MAG: hypothetical protein GX774_13075 [Armatimonadetes bacterium]|nr:hypothetical protein [Armatimonadota bacterium]
MGRSPGARGAARKAGLERTFLAAKWAGALVAVAAGSFLISLYCIAPHVRTPAGEAPTTPAAADHTASSPLPTAEPAPVVPRRAEAPVARADNAPSDGVLVRPAPRRPGVPSDDGTVTIRPTPAPPRVSPPVPGAGEPASASGETLTLAPLSGGEADAAASTATGETPLYRVEVGAPGSRAESDRLAQELRQRGFSAHVVTEGSIHHVQAGAFRSRRNAEKLATELGNQGYAATIAGGPNE